MGLLAHVAFSLRVLASPRQLEHGALAGGVFSGILLISLLRPCVRYVTLVNIETVRRSPPFLSKNEGTGGLPRIESLHLGQVPPTGLSPSLYLHCKNFTLSVISFHS